MNFGALLHLARTDHGLTLLDLAKQTGIAVTNLHRMEVGERPPPAPEKVQAIMRAIGLDRRSSQLLLFLASHEMPEKLAHLALQERTLAIEDFESAALMRWVEIHPEHISKPAWVTVVKRLAHIREDVERGAALTIPLEAPAKDVTK